MNRDNPNVNLWSETANSPEGARPALDGSRSVDIAIVGAGYTGLWTAYYLKSLAPELSIAILEAQTAGFGASGRNGGWLKGSMAGDDKYLDKLAPERKAAGYALLHGIVDHVHQILLRENIDCGFHKGGVLFAAARYPEQLRSQTELLKRLRKAGHTEEDYRWLDAHEMTEHVRMSKPYGAVFSPHCAVIHPGQLVRGLAKAVERRGVVIYEKTPVTRIHDHCVSTARGTVQAKTIVLAMEGYSGSVRGYGKFVLPVQSMIVATEPLSATQWDEIGLLNRPAFSDGGKLVTYGQRTEDDRLVFGARGAYQFGAKPCKSFALPECEYDLRAKLMRDLFPSLRTARITHAWGGTMGMARQFAPHAVFDRHSGIAMAGGYGGGGVGAANLMARTLADLILERGTGLTQMPWVFHDASPNQALQKWEPEPIPWLAYRAIQGIYSWEESLYVSAQVSPWRKQLAGQVSKAVSGLLK